MIKKPLIISLILIWSMIVTSKTTAMLQEDDIKRVNTVMKAHIEREQTINNLVGRIESKSLWSKQHAVACGENCGGGGLMCQGGGCKFSDAQGEVLELKRQVLPILEESNKYRPYILKLIDLRHKVIEEVTWIKRHGPLTLGSDENCTSPLCNSQCQAYVPFMLTCLLFTHQTKAVQLRNKMLDTLNKIDSL